MKKLQVSIAALLALVLLTSLSACAPAKLSMDNVTEIIDTRTAEEYNKSHIVGAINIEMATGGFIAEAVEVENKGTIYVYGETVEEAAEAENVMSVLMGDDVESRKAFIQKNARDVRNLDF